MTLLPFEDLPPPKTTQGFAFPEFWQAYPRKQAKTKAAFAYKKALKRATHSEIMDGLARYKRNKPDYCDWMLPTTFLNGARWEDEYDAPAPKRSSYTPEQLQTIAAHVKRPWYERGRYSREVLEQCRAAGFLTAEEVEAKS